jgi:HEAT repeat protein
MGFKGAELVLVEQLAAGSYAAGGEGVPMPEGPGCPYYYWCRDGRGIVAWALGRLEATSAAPALLDVLREKGSGGGYLGHVIIPILGELRHREAIDELKAVLAAPTLALAPTNSRIFSAGRLQDEKAAIDRLAARTLYQLGDDSGRGLLLEEIETGDRDARDFGADAIGRFGTGRDVPVLIRHIRGPYATGRHACAGLERITGVKPPANPSDLLEPLQEFWSDWWREHRYEYPDELDD